MANDTDLRLVGRELSREYDFRPVFSNVSLDLRRGDLLCITGENGAGKSTLLKLLFNVLRPTHGAVEWVVDFESVRDEDLLPHLGVVAPYLHLYTEFTLMEHLEISAKMRGVERNLEEETRLVDAFGLSKRRHDLLGSYSSGMLQRARLILAMAHQPRFLVLDEPTMNLDEIGIRGFRDEVSRGRDRRITLLATNSPEDLSLGTHRLDLGKRVDERSRVSK